MQGWHSEGMSERIQLPDIAEEVQTPLVKELLEIIERLAQRVRQQDERIAQLKDEIAVLKPVLRYRRGREEASPV